MIKETVKGFGKICICNLCKHEWLSKLKELPIQCPKCKRPDWNEIKKKKRKK